MVLSLSVPELISDPIVERRDQEVSGMKSQAPAPAIARKTTIARLRPHRTFGNSNGRITTLGIQATRDPREAVSTIAQNESTVVRPASQTMIFRRSCTAK